MFKETGSLYSEETEGGESFVIWKKAIEKSMI